MRSNTVDAKSSSSNERLPNLACKSSRPRQHSSEKFLGRVGNLREQCAESQEERSNGFHVFFSPPGRMRGRPQPDVCLFTACPADPMLSMLTSSVVVTAHHSEQHYRSSELSANVATLKVTLARFKLPAIKRKPLCALAWHVDCSMCSCLSEHDNWLQEGHGGRCLAYEGPMLSKRPSACSLVSLARASQFVLFTKLADSVT